MVEWYHCDTCDQDLDPDEVDGTLGHPRCQLCGSGYVNYFQMPHDEDDKEDHITTEEKLSKALEIIRGIRFGTYIDPVWKKWIDLFLEEIK